MDPSINDPKASLEHLITFDGVARILHVGDFKIMPSNLCAALFGDKVPKNTDRTQVFGFGETSGNGQVYHTHIPAPNREFSYDRHIVLQNPMAKGQNYPFDMAVLDLRCYTGSKMSILLDNMPSIWADTMGFLKPGGLMIVIGELYEHQRMVGSYSFRLEQWHMVQDEKTGLVIVLGTKRETPSPNLKAKRLMLGFLGTVYGEVEEIPRLSLLAPANIPYVVKRGMAQDPIAYSKTFTDWYVLDRIEKAGIPRPFEEIRKFLFLKGTTQKVRTPLTPTVGNLAKLATLADGKIVDADGNVWVIKGTPETSESEGTEDGVLIKREVKRLKISALQIAGSQPGRLILSQLG